jgi:glycosyltransferase involved in cell wall biosynthesis
VSHGMSDAIQDLSVGRDIRIVDIINLSSSADSLLKERVLAMRASGFDNRIVCAAGPYVAPLRRAGIPVHTVHLPRGLDPLQLPVALAEIATYLWRERIDLVHTHCSVPGAVGRMAAWLAGVPVVIHTVHGFHFHAGTPWLKRLPYLMVERLAGMVTDTLLTQNRSDLELAERFGIGPRRRRRWIGNGVDVRRFQPAPQPKAAGETVTITCVARFEPVKNHAMLFEALRLLKLREEPFRVWLVGEGRLRRDYEAQCARLGIADRVEFLGYRDDVHDLLARSDIAVLTSSKEGIPRAVLEAMAAGVPVVATRVPGTREAVWHGETGLLVPLDDASVLAGALGLLIASPELRSAMGARGRAVAVRNHDERAVIGTLRWIYRARLLVPGGVTRISYPEVWHERARNRSRARR